MGSIFEEYRRRHRISTVAAITEGVLFLEKEGTPAAICTTSSHTKSIGTCRGCRSKTSEVVAELMVVTHFPNLYSPVCHEHISADTDVIGFISRFSPAIGKMEPYVSKGERDQERWLWNFFLASTQTKRGLGTRAFAEMYSREGRCQDPSMSWIDDQFWLATNHADIYSQYYESVYSQFSINRKYLLLV